MAYNYGPPPPPPQPTANNTAGAYAPSYGQHYQQNAQPRSGGHGRGQSTRGGYQQSSAPYGYGPNAHSYGQQVPTPFPGPTQGVYPHQAQPPHQQHWHPEHGQQNSQAAQAAQPGQPGQPPSHAPLPAQNYHPNYAPQIYQQSQPHPHYGAQAYPTTPQTPYGPNYAHQAPVTTPHAAPAAQSWGAHQAPQAHGSYGARGQHSGRGGRGGYNDRNGPKMMGPPIRIGFDSSHASHAPVSNTYPVQPYGAPPVPPAPYTTPYQPFPPAPAYVHGPAPPYDGGSSGHQHSRQHNRGGFHFNHSKPRHQLGGDKLRHRSNRSRNAHTPPSHHQKPDGAAGKKKKRKTNVLGLTPGDESEEDDENEEERLNQMYGAEAPNSSDLVAWLAERRANFPTKARIEAKRAARAENGEAAKNGESGKHTTAREAALEKKRLKAEKLRKQLEKVESSIKRKREQQDEGDDMRDHDASSTSSSNSDAEDDKPEAMSTRQDSSFLPPPPSKADPTKHCKYYSTGGTCGKRGKCRFVHDPSVREAALRERELNGGQMTLQQRLMLNDKEQEDLTIVQTLKYLQDKGVLNNVPTAKSFAAASNAQPELNPTSPCFLPPPPIKKEVAAGTGVHGLPPIPPRSAVSNGPKYAGWNMNGFGNAGRH